MTRVTCGITCFNQEDTIRRAIFSALDQAAPGIDIEVLVVDDGSTDSSVDIAERAGATVIQQENSGQCATRQAIQDNVTGEYLRFLDGDDWFIQYSTEPLLEFMTENDLDAAWGYFRAKVRDEYVDSIFRYESVERLILPDDDERAFMRGAPQIGTVLFRNEDLPDWRPECREMGTGAVEYYISDFLKQGKKGAHLDLCVLNYETGIG